MPAAPRTPFPWLLRARRAQPPLFLMRLVFYCHVCVLTAPAAVVRSASAPLPGVPTLVPKPAPAAVAAQLPDGTDREVCLGVLPTKIVGVRYYTGVTHAGEFVRLLREPTNAYDPNAIAVNNLNNVRVGHIPRTVASALADVMDDADLNVRIEAFLPLRGERNQYELAVTLTLYGPVESAATVSRLLKRSYDATLRPGSGAAAAPPVGARPVVEVKRVVVSGNTSQQEMDKMFDALGGEASKLPPVSEADIPCLASSLFPHQQHGVAWMLNRERNPDKGVPRACPCVPVCRAVPSP